MDSKMDFTQGSIFWKLVHFMVPILGSLILQAMYGAVDLLVVGRFGTTAGLSGVSTGSNVMNLITFIVAGFSMGVTVLISRYIGEKDLSRIGNVMGGAAAVFTVWAVVLMVLLVGGADQIAALMQAPPEAFADTVLYIRICGGGIFFIVAYNVLSAVFRGLGDSRSPLIFVTIACLVNIVGDLALVAGLGLNAAGAALATVLAQFISVLAALYIAHLKHWPYKFSWKSIHFNSEVPNFSRIGTPIAFQELLTQLSFMAIVAFINRLGLEASSGYGVANKLVGFIMLIPGALEQSMSSFVAQNVGAGKEDRAKLAMKTGMALGAGIGVIVGTFVFFRGDFLASLFTEDPRVIARAFEYLKGFMPETVVTAFLFSFIGYYNGHEKTAFVMFQGIAQTCLVRVPVSYFMSIRPNPSLTQIGLAAPLATVFPIFINLCYFWKHFAGAKAEKNKKTTAALPEN